MTYFPQFSVGGLGQFDAKLLFYFSNNLVWIFLMQDNGKCEKCIIEKLTNQVGLLQVIACDLEL